jgi:hypothetical protein
VGRAEAAIVRLATVRRLLRVHPAASAGCVCQRGKARLP